MTITDSHTDVGWIATDKLQPHPDNLRADLGDLTELAASIDAVGIIQPIVIDAEMRVLAGHRRLAAAQQLGLTEVPVTLRTVRDDADVVEVFLIENLQRAGLNPIEEGTGYARLVECGLTQREIAERCGCNQSHVSKRIKLTTLPEVAQGWLRDGLLLVDDALELAKLEGDSLDAAVAELVAMREQWAKAGSGASAFAGYNVESAMKRVIARQRHADALAEGKASKLKRLDRRPHKGAGEFEPCKKAEATHWFVEDGQATIIWARKYERSTPTAKPADPSIAPSAVTAPGQTFSERQAQRDDRRERRETTLRAAATDEPAALLRLALACMMTEIRERGEALVWPPIGWDLTDLVPESAFAVMAIEQHANEAEERVAGGDDLTPEERCAYDALVELGYELDDEERAALPGLDGPTTVEEVDKARAMVAETIALVEAEAVAPGKPAQECECCGSTDHFACGGPEPTTMEEAEAQALAEDMADEWDQQRSTPPWKAYAFTDETKTIGGIREHRNPAKLRWARVYEEAHRNRPLVLAAIDERLAELGE